MFLSPIITPTSNIYNAIKKRKDLIEDNEINNNDSKIN